MRRSTGVTISAVVVFIGCAAALLIAVLMALSFQLVQDQTLANPILRVVLVVEVLVVIGCVGWGVAAGVGLLKLRSWGRISMLVFSAIMVFFCALPMIFVPFIPFPMPEDSPANLVLFIRIGLELFYAFFVALGVIWLVYFNRRSVKMQFQGAIPAAQGVAYQPPLQTGVQSPPALVVASTAGTPSAGPRRPVPILIIAIFLIIGSCSIPFALMVHTPVPFLGVQLQGTERDLVFLMIGALNLVAGIGLIKMRYWGWVAALITQAVGFANTACLFLLPGTKDYFDRLMAEQSATFGVPPDMTSSSYVATLAIVRGSMAFGFIVAILVIWALIHYRKLFRPLDANATVQ